MAGGTARYCAAGIWYRPRQPDMSDTAYQLTNWMHLIWLSGDHIAEQAVHNIDTVNWVMGANPVSAYGSGGRFTRPADSEMWDSFSIDYEYPGNRTISFKCRQIPGTTGDVSTVINGTKGTCFIAASNGGSRIVDRDGRQLARCRARPGGGLHRSAGDVRLPGQGVAARPVSSGAGLGCPAAGPGIRDSRPHQTDLMELADTLLSVLTCSVIRSPS